MTSTEHAIRVAYSEYKGDDSQRQNACDTLAEEGLSRAHRQQIMSIFDGCNTEDEAVREIIRLSDVPMN